MKIQRIMLDSHTVLYEHQIMFPFQVASTQEWAKKRYPGYCIRGWKDKDNKYGSVEIIHHDVSLSPLALQKYIITNEPVLPTQWFKALLRHMRIPFDVELLPDLSAIAHQTVIHTKIGNGDLRVMEWEPQDKWQAHIFPVIQHWLGGK